MATYAANHISLVLTMRIKTGTYANEICSWGFRVAADKPDINAGSVNLPTFITTTDAATDTITLNTRSYTRTRTWAPGQWSGVSGKNVTLADIDALVSYIELFQYNLRGNFPTNSEMLDIKVICPGVDGKAHTGSNVYTPVTPTAGTSGTPLPIEDAICVSLYTANLTKSGRGRFYFGPLNNSNLGTDGLVASAEVTSILTKAATMLNSVRSLSPTGGVPGYSAIVWSRVDKSKGSIVNKVRVGDEFDQHETRGKQRPESFSSATLTP